MRETVEIIWMATPMATWPKRAGGTNLPESVEVFKDGRDGDEAKKETRNVESGDCEDGAG